MLGIAPGATAMNNTLRIVAIIGNIAMSSLFALALLSGEFSDLAEWAVGILVVVVGIVNLFLLFQSPGKDKEERGLEQEIRKAELRKKLDEIQPGEGPPVPTS